MMQGKVNRLDLGTQYIIDDQFSLGILVSTIPLKNVEEASTISSISSFASVKWMGFRFGYSYDMNTTKLFNTGGIHEFSVAYDFNINIRELDRYKCIPFF